MLLIFHKRKKVHLKLVYGSKKIRSKSDVYYIDKNDLYIHSEVAAFEKAISILNEIENKMIKGEKIPHLFKYSDISLWWFIHPSIIQSVKESVNFLDNFQEIINKKRPTLIYITSEFDKLHLIKQLCKRQQIPIQYSKLQYFKFQIKRLLILKIQPHRFRRITLKKIKTRLSLFNDKYKNIPSLRDKIIFAGATVYRRNIYDPNKGQVVSGEFIQGPIIDIIKKLNFEVVGIDIDYTFTGDTEALSKRLDDSTQWFPIEVITEKFSITLNNHIFIKNYLKIINHKDFKDLFNFNGINFWTQMEYDFKKMSYFPYLPSYIKLIASLEQFFNNNRPRAVFIPYEAGSIALTIIIACKKNNIKTIGLQHGIIFGTNPDYSHHDFRSENNPLGIPLPDYLLLFGNFPKKLLRERGTYPPEKLIEFGHPMYFDIDKIKKSLDALDLKTKYAIPKNKKIILFTTGRYQSYYKGYEKQNYDEKILNKLLETYANNEEFYVILKPHPIGEYLDYYKNLISKYDCKNFVIIQGDLFELLHISDIVVCYFSTILIDSIMFEKMVIEVTFDDKRFMLFDEYEVFIKSSLDSLPENIHKLLSDSKLQAKIKENSTKFIKEQFNIPNENVTDQLRFLLSSK